MKAKVKKIAYLSTGGLFMVAPAFASVDEGAGYAQAPSTPASLFSIFHTISSILIYIVGAVAVIMLIVGGFRYVTSQGDAGAVKQAKDTILYSIIGIVVAITAYAIVNFVAGSLIGSGVNSSK